MHTIKLNGKDVEVPDYPHHKDSIYRMHTYLKAKTAWDYLGWRDFEIIKGAIRGVKYRCILPHIMLIDPSNACNLRCKGCWAADYDREDRMTYETLSNVISQAKALGTIDFLFTGGEPLMRRKELLRLAKEHSDVCFSIFTNGTLLDRETADESARLGNVIYFISLEGFREDTDFRRGVGVYDQIMKAMALLKERDLAFAFSACYHRDNYKTIASDAFLDHMRECGAWAGWMFHYMPVGSDADPSLVCSPEERRYVLEAAQAYSQKHDFMLFDFINAGHSVYGCVAAGNGYIHINANGDVEPCAFCHYSDCNIHDKSLLECYQSPFLRRFRSHQPFSENPFRACPMLDAPEHFVSIVNETGARSTHNCASEPAEALIARTQPIAQRWKPIADELYAAMDPEERLRYERRKRVMRLRRMLTDGRISK